jgi:protein O-mannosyl-transferase
MNEDRRKKKGVEAKPKPVRPRATSPSVRHSAFESSVLWILLGLIALNILIYADVLHYAFVNFDDDDYVYANPAVASGLTLTGIWWALTTNHQGNWHPVTWLSHMLDVQLFGLKAGGHHATNLILHILSSMMLFWLFHRMTHEIWQSAFVAAIFAAHPLHVESVAWVAERKDVLSTLFFMLTVWAYLRYVREPGLRRYGLVCLCFGLGLMSKAMLVTLPFVLLLIDFWPLRRVSGKEGISSTIVGKLVREKIPLIGFSAASSIVTYIVQQQGKAITSSEQLPFHLRAENALVSYVEYIEKIFWPANLATLYPYSLERSVSWKVALAILFVISALAIRAWKRYPYVPMGWFWFLGTLVPVIGLVQVGRQSMADRYAYVPLIGISVIVAWGAADLLVRVQNRKWILASAAVLVVLMCTVVASQQVQTWENSLAMWGHTIAVTKDNYTAEHGLAAELGLLGRNEEAIAHLKEALRIRPDYPDAHYNMGLELVDLGKYDEAGIHFSEAVRLAPNFAIARNNWGNILVAQGKMAEAEAQYSEALRISPDYVDARSNLASAYIKQGKVNDARRELLEVLKLNPTHPNAQAMLRGLNEQTSHPDSSVP